MRLDTPSILYLRNPYGDESLNNIVRAAAVCDDGKRVETLMNCVDLREMRVDLLFRSDDVLKHIRRYNCNLLIMPTEQLGEQFFAGLTLRLLNLPVEMPFLVNVGGKPSENVLDLVECYKKCLHVSWGDPAVCGANVKRFISREVMSLAELSLRLRQCAALTLKAMHCRTGTTLEYLIDEVTLILENSFVFFGSENELHRETAERRRVDPVIIAENIRAETEQAMKAMSVADFAECFSVYTKRGIKPGAAEFVYAAARITSYNSSQILRHIKYRPK